VFLFDLIDFLGQFNLRICHFATKTLVNYAELKKTIRILEDAAEIHSHPFPDVSVLKCNSTGIFVWAAYILMLIVSMVS